MASKINPTASYEWKPETEFKFSGVEFEYIKDLVQACLNAQEVPRVIYALEVDKILRRVFEAGIESGVITEKAQEKLVMPNKTLVGTDGIPLTN